MKYTFAAVSITLLLAGCGTTQEATAPTEHLELVSMTPLPSVTSDAYATGMKLNVLMHVLADGTVENVRMLGTSGDAGWDTLALGSMKQWRYAPYLIGGQAKAVIFTVTFTFALSDIKEEMQAEKTFDEYPKKISDVKPVYPEEALKQGIQGLVLVEATTDEKGNVVAVKVLPGKNPQPLLEEAAVTAVKQWKFAPAIKDGKAVSVTFTVNIKFALK